MKRHIVRLWVDVLVKGASTDEDAVKRAKAGILTIGNDKVDTVQVYDTQWSGQVWERVEEEP